MPAIKISKIPPVTLLTQTKIPTGQDNLHLSSENQKGWGGSTKSQ